MKDERRLRHLIALAASLLVINISLFILNGNFTFLDNKADAPLNEVNIEDANSNETDCSYKTFVTIGDSITARDNQHYGLPEDQVNIGYQQLIKDKLSMDNYINIGISGATITRGTEWLRGLTKLAMDYQFGDVEFIIVQAGTNDFNLNVPLGELDELNKEDPDRYTFIGAYEGLLRDLRRNNSNADIYIFTPTQRSCKEFDSNCHNEIGLGLDNYVEAVKLIGVHNNVKVVDMYNDSEIKKDTLNEFTVDGLHMNNKGYEVMFNKFMDNYNAQ